MSRHSMRSSASSNSPKILDLFCGAGGAAMGYHRAGFEVVGIDIVDQPDYPFAFIQGNALHLTYEFLWQFDAIHASPPCQQYSCATAVARRHGKQYPDLYPATKRMLVASGLPFVIENVPGSPIRGGLGLCGTQFDLGVLRHRLFEVNWPVQKPEQRCSCNREVKMIDRQRFVTVAGNACTKREGLQAMGIDWNMSKLQMNEAIPPAYTQFIGGQLFNLVSAGPQHVASAMTEYRALADELRAGVNYAQLLLW